MSGFTAALIYIIQTLGGLYLLVAVLRFILQLVQADFYNPLSQFIVRATQPLAGPLRRVIPSIGRLDAASLLLSIVLQLLLMSITLALAGFNPLNLLSILLLWSLLGIASLFLKVFFFALIASVIISWLAPASRNPAAQLIEQLCWPLLAPFRRFLPSLGGLDISPIFAFIAINLLDRFVLGALLQASGLVGPMKSIVGPFF